MNVVLFVESDDELSLQALTLAESLGEVKAVSFEGPFAPAAWAGELASRDWDVLVGPGSERGNEVLAHVAAQLDLPFAANVIEVRGDEVTRQRWGGTLLEEARIHAPRKLATAAPFAFAASSSPSHVETLRPELDGAVQVVEHITPDTVGKVSLADAKVVVSGGRGVGSAEGFAILEELAELLEGAVGCSRVVTSAGWRPHTDQVGQTGTKVSPDLYIACGISGATQHIAGCKGAKKLLAINEDPEATIFNHADYAVIGNLHEIVPAITAELRKVRSS